MEPAPSANRGDPEKLTEPSGDPNAILATGSVMACLLASNRVLPEPVQVRLSQPATNQIFVRFPHLKSAYAITVEMIPGTEQENPELSDGDDPK